MARYLPNGLIELIGREDNQIKLNGHRIELGEIDATLVSHPAVRESLVYPTEHPQYGELPCADIVLRDESEGSDLDATDVRRFCYRYLAPYKVPKEFRRVPRLEKTASGKLKRWPRAPGG